MERSAAVVACDDGTDHVVQLRPGPGSKPGVGSPQGALPGEALQGQGVAAGDWVGISGSSIRVVLDRWSALTRRDPSGSGVQVLAANVDLVLVTTPADRSSAARVERELTAAWDAGARPVVVLTKVDLEAALEAGGDLEGDGAGGGGGRLVAELSSRLVGADVIGTSAHSGAGIEQVRALLRPCRTAVLLGPSGAGKSTFANALLGSDVQATGVVRDADSRGRHTTTARQLLCVPGGGVLIDTPGLRSFGLAGPAELGDVFPEIDELARECRFSDCAHESEPSCAVLDAVARGTIDVARLTSYKKLRREVEVERWRVDPVARQAQRQMLKQRGREGRARGQEKRRGQDAP
ncbi:ribosome small subunit-dependent GTPase A [Ferrimicrobium sp.]|uniref:ribosome small subunit-dependent GTPase A n=1 Tax=Ferrimicrobium sp. TaxID=2926050 RepID=UPI0026098A3F|nr:ribosome small subunit-dependent GTPase A [Ferrimicrobium sp.]